MNNNTLNSGWNTVTNPNSLWFGVQVWVHDFDVFPGQDPDHVTVTTADDAPQRQFMFLCFNKNSKNNACLRPKCLSCLLNCVIRRR